MRVELLGELTVRMDGRVVGPAAWPTRRAQELVALLALAEGRRATRDGVVEQLWPHLGAQAGAANLRKAAHHARRVLGDADAVVLRGGVVELLPGAEVETDVEVFLRAADEALRSGEPEACARAAEIARGGELLPSAPYEPWTQEPRRRVRERLGALLRAAGDLERLVAFEPADEAAARELMARALAEGRRHAALRTYERLRVALARELGAAPSPETRALYDRCTDGVRLGERLFVGRVEELAAARDVLRAATGGAAAALVVRGDSGIGKSAFCRELAARAAEDGWRLLETTATRGGPPYAPVAAAVEQLVVRGETRLDALPAHARAVLAELTPVAGAPGRTPVGLTRHQVIGALRRAMAGRRPVLLQVEDAHLTDEATADVLHQLAAGSSAGVPFVVVLALRSDWVRTSLPRGVADLARAATTTAIELGPLRDAEVAELVRAHVEDPVAVSRIAGAAAGSPFFALELARAKGAVPRSLRAAITERFDGVGPDALEHLSALAVAEHDLELGDVLALTGLDEDAAADVLDAALAAGVLVVAGARYRFGHELVRQALVDGLAPHRVVALHRAAATRLQRAGRAPARIARHLLAGDRAADAVPFLLAAARDDVAVGAFADARGELARLLRVAPDHVEALVLHAEVLEAVGDATAPQAYARAAHAVGPPDDQDLLARMACSQLKASDPVQAIRTLEGVTPRSTVGRLAQALTYSAAAAVGVFGDRDTAARMADEAHRLALELGDPGAILDATWAHALAAHAKGELPQRLREYLRQTSALPEIATRVFDGQLCVTERMLHGGLPNEELIAFADGLAEEAARLGAARGHAFALTLRGEAGLLAGRLERAERDFVDGAREHGAIGALAGEALSLVGRAQVAVAQGRHRHARPFLDDALLMARESEVGHHTLDRVFGAMVEATPDPDQALAVLAEAETAVVGPAETCPTCRIAYVVPAAIAAAKAGDLERALRYREDVRVAMEHIALPPAWHAAAEEVYGHCALAEGREGEARAHFAAAADGFRHWGQPLDAERCRERLGNAVR